jgi:hypothetical protein
VFDENGISSGAAVRQSTKVDFYYDGMLCMSKNEDKDRDYSASDVEVSFDETFVRSEY